MEKFIYSENLIKRKLKIIKIIKTTNVPEDKSEQKPLPKEVLKNSSDKNLLNTINYF